MKVVAPAKLNLYLQVGDVRADGFHEVRTIFSDLSLHDELWVAPAPAFRLLLTGNYAGHLAADTNNLAARAARALAVYSGVRPNVALTLRKQIPVAAGLGGGSADAAATLRACDALWRLQTPTAQLAVLAAQLGSDVPFCLQGGVAVGDGRGEQLRPVLAPHAFHWVLLPSVRQLSASAVYAELDRLRLAGGNRFSSASDATLSAALAAVKSGDPSRLARVLRNDLAPAALSLLPELAQTLATGAAAGALAEIVCGSGPTCALLAADAGHAAELADALGGTQASGLYATPLVVRSGVHAEPLS
ncbi:MAG: 4-(cytidine 5'-diphospho)-2-C-methyl-D-erythritol kinase [Acidimicrobiales bacterium]|nr:MAG: 4-(cytidine 5'-diphospho)-2-C-methyl-D-erythritol kinase [Acidimicrobiales bacterium]